MKKLSIIAMLAASLSFSATSCDDYLDVNNNIDAPDYIDGYLYLAGICQNYQGLYYDIRATGPLTQMMGTSSYSNYANHYYSKGSDAAAEMFRVAYWLHGMNLENMINQSVAAENWTLAGIGTAIKAFDWDFLTKMHGDLPYQDAYIPGKLSHNYDSQEFIMGKARELAYQAIEYLKMEDKTIYGTKISNNDHIYWGDKGKWIKFCYAVIVRNLAALSNKTNFVSDYADELISAAGMSFNSNEDNATVFVAGAGEDATASSYNNFWCPRRSNLSNSYWQHDYAVQVMTGTVPAYDENTGDKIDAVYPEGEENTYYPFELNEKQIICDTVKAAGHFDPRVVLKLGTGSNTEYADLGVAENVMSYQYYGASFTSSSGPIGTATNFYGTKTSSTAARNGAGRWLYREAAPYIMMTYAEIQFCLAEAYWKKGDKSNALAAWKNAVAADMDFTGSYIETGEEGGVEGDKIKKDLYNELAEAYVAGQYVGEMTADDLTLSHIMMQKWVALFPWGANEAWVDMRKYHYDIPYSGDYPKNGNGWDLTSMDH